MQESQTHWLSALSWEAEGEFMLGDLGGFSAGLA